MIKTANPIVEKISSTRAEGELRRRAAILDGAEKVFLEEGFQAASMAAIAQRADVSKGTLYNYFPSKDDLFLACVSRHCEVIQTMITELMDTHSDLKETLTQFGRRYLAVVYSDDVVNKFRMVIAEATRVPQIARAFYEMGPGRGVQLVADYLEQQMRAGVLNVTDPSHAAQNFLSLCASRFQKARLCNVVEAPDAEAIARDVDVAVRVFLAGYSTSQEH